MRALDHQEVEWQFDAGDLDSVENWLNERSSSSGFAILPEEIKDLTDAYYDTEDWRIYRAGYALRVRRDGKEDRKSTRLNSSHANISYAVFCLKKKKPTTYCQLAHYRAAFDAITESRFFKCAHV